MDVIWWNRTQFFLWLLSLDPVGLPFSFLVANFVTFSTFFLKSDYIFEHWTRIFFAFSEFAHPPLTIFLWDRASPTKTPEIGQLSDNCVRSLIFGRGDISKKTKNRKKTRQIYSKFFPKIILSRLSPILFPKSSWVGSTQIFCRRAQFWRNVFFELSLLNPLFFFFGLS